MLFVGVCEGAKEVPFVKVYLSCKPRLADDLISLQPFYVPLNKLSCLFFRLEIPFQLFS